MEYTIIFYEDEESGKEKFSREEVENKIKKQLCPLISTTKEILSGLGLSYRIEWDEFFRQENAKLRIKSNFKFTTPNGNQFNTFLRYPRKKGTSISFCCLTTDRRIWLEVNENGVVNNKEKIINWLKINF